MSVEETAEKIENMSIRGAGLIARSAARALADYARDFEPTGPEPLAEFMEGLDKAARRLLATRPTAIALTNGVRLALRGVREQPDLASARQRVMDNVREFVEMSESAVRQIGQHALGLMEGPGKAITICNSSAAISAMVACHRSGLITGVYACETRPKRQGLITVRELAAAGVPVTLIVDSAMRQVMPGVSIAFVGADTVEHDGSVVNKVGTHLLAIAARDCGVPFYACAETYKFMPASMKGQRVEIEVRPVSEIVQPGEIPDEVEVFNPVFDRVPPELVSGIVTQHGVIRPGQAADIIARYLGDI